MKYLIYILTAMILAVVFVGWMVIIGDVIGKIPARQFTITPLEEEPVRVEVELIGWREVTAYSSTVDQCDDTPFITASGERVKPGTIACPRYFPFGTKVLIEDRIYTCTDRMHADYIHRFDIWFDNRESALEFGRQILEVKKITIY